MVVGVPGLFIADFSNFMP